MEWRVRCMYILYTHIHNVLVCTFDLVESCLDVLFEGPHTAVERHQALARRV